MAEAETGRPDLTGYLVTGLLLGIAGLAWAIFGTTAEVAYGTIEGVSVFAVVYLIAQSSERVVEFVVNGLNLLPVKNDPESKKQKALAKIRKLDSTNNGNPTMEEVDEKTTQQANVDAARKELAFVGGGLSILLCAVGVNALNYGLMKHIGAVGVNADVDRLLTTLAAAGGTKTLHELIGRFEKAKESKEESG